MHYYAGRNILFTFHNVSINSAAETILINPIIKFTFHNVSINSSIQQKTINKQSNLHSIMYLLIPVLQLPLYHL